jgi:hypothetical protein
VVVNGVYASPGSRSWSLLRTVLRTVPVVTTSAVETDNWRRAGGTATTIEYGHTFGYPRAVARSGSPFRVFVGGSSDRDPELIAALSDEVEASEQPVQMIVADGSGPAEESRGVGTVIRPGWLPVAEFGTQLAASDVVFLPIRAGGRSAGHMVLVGALEAGVPVLVTSTAGVADYRSLPGLGVVEPGRPLLPQLRRHADIAAAERARMRTVWEDRYSTAAYVHRLLAAATDGS